MKRVVDQAEPSIDAKAEEPAPQDPVRSFSRDEIDFAFRDIRALLRGAGALAVTQSTWGKPELDDPLYRLIERATDMLELELGPMLHAMMATALPDSTSTVEFNPSLELFEDDLGKAA